MEKESKIKKTDKDKYIEAVGRRKTSVARARLFSNSGDNEFIVNGKKLREYFKEADLVNISEEALGAVKSPKGYKITAKITGGGIHSQAEALRHALARILIKIDADDRPVLKSMGFLRRDPRMKERRKFGLKKARKAPQWAKR